MTANSLSDDFQPVTVGLYDVSAVDINCQRYMSSVVTKKNEEIGSATFESHLKGCIQENSDKNDLFI